MLSALSQMKPSICGAPTPLLVAFHARMARRRGVVAARQAPSWRPSLTGLRDLELPRHAVVAADMARHLRAAGFGAAAKLLTL